MDCKNCGKCCQGLMPLLVFQSDYERIQLLLGEKTKTFIIPDGDHYRMIMDEKGTCQIFDEKTKRCQIYEQRPLICRIYPISFRHQRMADISLDPSMFFLTLCEHFQSFVSNDWYISRRTIKAYIREMQRLKLFTDHPTDYPDYVKIQKEFPLDLYLDLYEREHFLELLSKFNHYFIDQKRQMTEYNLFVNTFMEPVLSKGTDEEIYRALTQLSKMEIATIKR